MTSSVKINCLSLNCCLFPPYIRGTCASQNKEGRCKQISDLIKQGNTIVMLQEMHGWNCLRPKWCNLLQQHLDTTTLFTDEWVQTNPNNTPSYCLIDSGLSTLVYSSHINTQKNISIIESYFVPFSHDVSRGVVLFAYVKAMGFLYTRVKLNNNTILNLINVHLIAKECTPLDFCEDYTIRATELDDIISFVQKHCMGEYWLIGGDFNIDNLSNGEYTIANFKKRLETCKLPGSSIFAYTPKTTTLNNAVKFGTHADIQSIDHFYSNLPIDYGRVITENTTEISDHFPIQIQLEIPLNRQK